VLLLAISAPAWADIPPPPPIKRLSDPNRAKVLAALAGLIILGFGMVLLTWLGARITQRYRHGTSYFQPTPRPSEHAWAKKPLTPPAGDSPTDH
jgi:hypothetical protein